MAGLEDNGTLLDLKTKMLLSLGLCHGDLLDLVLGLGFVECLALKLDSSGSTMGPWPCGAYYLRKRQKVINHNKKKNFDPKE
jgi:hypothetical protein